MAEGVASTELAKSDNTFYGLMRRLLRSKADFRVSHYRLDVHMCLICAFNSYP